MRHRLAALSLTLALAVSACGGMAAPASSPPASAGGAASAQPAGDLQAIVDGARKEGALTLTYGEGTLGGNEGAQKIGAALNKQYGLNLNIQQTPGPSMPEMVSKVMQEYQTSRPASTDIVVGYAETILPAVQSGLFQQVDWSAWAPNIKDPQLTASAGGAVAVQTSIAGITVNTAKLKGASVPSTLQDLLKPEYKGHLASTPYAAYFDFLATDSLWGEQKTTDYLTAFTKQVAGLIRCNEINRVASGEFDAFAIACSQSDSLIAKQKGQPIDFVVPSDAPLALFLYVGVPKNAPHPNAAKLWVNQLLSPEAQTILYDVNAADLHVLPGSKTAGELQSLAASGKKPVLQTVEWLQDHYLPKGPDYRVKFQKMLASAKG
ncbi:MAG TPA: extracellular solute-binding protein [Chloroflexota bacterium]|nr:extracellular solute-binding protein [Chloroflexota bacterium]